MLHHILVKSHANLIATESYFSEKNMLKFLEICIFYFALVIAFLTYSYQ